MSAGRDFLLEIGTEELPARAAASAREQAAPLVQAALADARVEVDEDSISTWVTPRRIAVLVRGLPEVQPDQEIAERGPAAAAAFDEDGNPTRAAEGFARAKGVAVGDLEVREHQGREFVFAVRRREGRSLAEVLPDVCRRVIEGFSFSKTMRWDDGGLRFSRPVRWLVTKFGDETIGYEAFGLTSGDASRGHRLLAPGPVKIASAGSYLEALAAAKVIADQEQRRQVIVEGLDAAAAARHATWIDPAGELDEVVYLVEQPSVQAGEFDSSHLRLPAKVLVTAMQSHQRYFPLETGEGELTNAFLYVMNGDPSRAREITEGNERILEGRIEDAEFSFDKDLETGIEAMASRLDQVVFHRRLGSLADKTARLERLVETFAGIVGLEEAPRRAAAAAAKLAKADLVSVMVQEFPDLERYMGSVYANMEGFPGEVCTAIAEHYLPAAAGGELPSTVPGAVLAVCDKVDNIVGAFAVDELPTGSRDPYGLRRAAAGIAAICREFGFDFDLEELLAAAHHLYVEQKADIDRGAAPTREMFEFVADRIQQRQVEQGMPVEVFAGARASGLRSTNALVALAEALDSFRGEPAFEDLHTAYFRCAKIAAKAGEEELPPVDPSRFEDAAEEKLGAAIEELAPRLEELRRLGEYRQALAAAAAIRPAVDRFFDAVMVMADDEAVRRNRLALVRRVADVLSRLGDPMQVAAAPKP